MTYLINRNPSGRIICLHALLKYLYDKFRTENFTLKDMKYDANSEKNIHQSCTLLEKPPSLPFKICPYLENPLSPAKCYLTQSIQKDTQKSKSVSDAFNALEGLGFVERTANGGKITDNGKKFVSVDYYEDSAFEIIKSGMLSYGPFIGLLNEFTHVRGIVKRSEIKLGYPVTRESVKHNGKTTPLSTGSQPDTITRTRSVLLIWAITGGFAIPEDFEPPEKNNQWHVEMLPYIKGKKWLKKSKVQIDKNFFDTKKFVDNPLNYLSMTKSTKALRERNQDTIRTQSLKFEEIIKNRRFAIVYLLALASDNNKNINFSKSINEMMKYPDLFIIDEKVFDKIMYIEADIAPVSGIPFTDKNGIYSPLTKININELKKGAPDSLIKTIDEIYKRVET